jgi:hypothetical protein
MKSLKIILLAGIVCLLSCNDGNSSRLEPKKMQAVLSDMHLAEAYAMVVDKDSARKNTERNPDTLATYYKAIFTHYNITPEAFQTSLNWYKLHPEELDSIYASMIPAFSKLEGQYPNR